MKPKAALASMDQDTALRTHLDSLSDDAYFEAYDEHIRKDSEPTGLEAEVIAKNVIHAVASGAIANGDMVNFPSHYARFKIEPIRFAVENNLNFLQANILKYVMRYDAKNGLEDLRKASRCLDMLIEFVKGNEDWWQKRSTANA